MRPARLYYIDWVKAICIFLMVVVHWNTNELVGRYIYSFHIPAFFFPFSLETCSYHFLAQVMDMSENLTIPFS